MFILDMESNDSSDELAWSSYMAQEEEKEQLLKEELKRNIMQKVSEDIAELRQCMSTEIKLEIRKVINEEKSKWQEECLSQANMHQTDLCLKILNAAVDAVRENEKSAEQEGEAGGSSNDVDFP